MIKRSDGSIFAQDFQSLSLFRIVFAAWLFVDFLLVSSCCYEDLYGETGILPISAHQYYPHISRVAAFLPVDGLTRFVGAIFPYVYPLAILAFGIGYRIRWSTAILFLLNTYLFWRNTYLNSGADTLAHLLLLWSLFLPMSRYWSVDSALDPEPRDRKYPVLPFVALKLQIYSVYVFAALFKAIGEPWMNGSAVRLALSDNVFGGTSVGLYLVEHFPSLLAVITYATIAFQLAFPFLVFWPWRNDWTRAFALIGAAAMHIAFILCLNIGGFPYLSLAILILLVPDAWIGRALRGRRERLSRATIYYEPGCGFCQKISLLFREFLLPPAAPVLPASADPVALRLLEENQSWVVRGADGATYLKWRGVTYLLKQNPLFATLGYLMDSRLLSWPMEKLYEWIGRNRERLGALTGALLSFRIQRPVGNMAIALCGMLATVALAYNVYSVMKRRDGDASARQWIYESRALPHAAKLLQVTQNWSLFAPVPTHARRQYQIFVHADDGSVNGAKDPLSGPWYRIRRDGSKADFSMHRWQKYFDRLQRLSESQWAALGRYMCGMALVRNVESAASVQAVELVAIVQPFDQDAPPTPDEVIQRKFSCTPDAKQKRSS